MRKPFPVALIIAMATFTLALGAENATMPQGTIYGHVYDAKSGEPIPSAFVRCEGKTTTTDNEGRYTIEGVFAPSTSYTVTCYVSGYPSSSDAAMTNSDGKAEVDFYLGSASAPIDPSRFEKPELKTIFDTITDADDFYILVMAIESTGFADLLKDVGPFTLFALKDPTGPPHDVAEIATLAETLTYYIAPGEYMAADLENMHSIKTLEGGALTIEVTDEGLMVNGAVVIMPDIVCSNGVIHVIDDRLLPTANETPIVEMVVVNETEPIVNAIGIPDVVSVCTWGLVLGCFEPALVMGENPGPEMCDVQIISDEEDAICSDIVTVTVAHEATPGPWGYYNENITIGDLVEVYGAYIEDENGCIITLQGSEDYYFVPVEKVPVDEVT